MAFKYYPAIQTSDGVQTPPLPMYLHNNNAAAITLNIAPFPIDQVFEGFDTSADVLSSFQTLPELAAAQSATPYATTTETGNGSGAVITVTTTEVDGVFVPTTALATTAGNNYRNGDVIQIIIDDENGTGIYAGLDTVSLVGTPVVQTVKTYTPTSDGVGTGFKVSFDIVDAGGGITALENVVYIEYGSGYVVGDIVTFSEHGQNLLWMLVPTDIGIYYPVNITVENADLVSDGLIPFVIQAGETAPFRGVSFSVVSATDVSVLAMSPLYPS